MRVLLDLDSTVYPLLDAMGSLPGGERIGYDDMPEWGSIVERAGGVPALLSLFERAFSWETMARFPPFDGCVDWLRRLSDVGAEFHLATDRPAETAEAVSRYLETHGIEIVSLHCEHGIDKAALVERLGIGLVIDDHPELMLRLADAPVRLAALEMQYNRDAAVASGAILGDGWHELGPKLLACVETSRV